MGESQHGWEAEFDRRDELDVEDIHCTVWNVEAELPGSLVQSASGKFFDEALAVSCSLNQELEQLVGPSGTGNTLAAG